MRIFLHIFGIFGMFLLAKCDKRFLKIDNCTSDVNLAKIERCEIVDGKCFIVFNVKKPVYKAKVRIA